MTSLVGAWRLVRWQIDYSDGRPPTYPYGSDAEGVLCYTGDGWMSALIGRPDRAPLSAASVRAAPAAERLGAFDSFFSYAGPYEVRGTQVVHKVVQALNPNFTGTEQVRDMTFGADGTLTLSAEDDMPGMPIRRTHRLVWRRVTD
jgi:hypothetical protein